MSMVSNEILIFASANAGKRIVTLGRKHRMGIDCVEVSTAFSGDAMIAMLGVLERDVPALSF